jgi:hypothetical protein
MAVQQNSAAVRAARQHVRAWSTHDWETARAGLAADVKVLGATIDPMPPRTDLTGVDEYMRGLIEFAQAVVPGSAEVITALGDDRHALLTLTVRVRFGPDAPEMTLPGSRTYLFDEHGRIAQEQVIFFVVPD